jgi:hypothetical protein
MCCKRLGFCITRKNLQTSSTEDRGTSPPPNLTKSLASFYIYSSRSLCRQSQTTDSPSHPGIARTPDPCPTDSWSISWPHQYTIPFNFGSQWRSDIQTLKGLQKLRTVWTLPTLGAKYMASHITFLLHVCVRYSTKCNLLTLRSKLSTGATRKLNLYLRWKYRITKCLSPKDRCMEMIRRVYYIYTHTHTRTRAHARTHTRARARARIETDAIFMILYTPLAFQYFRTNRIKLCIKSLNIHTQIIEKVIWSASLQLLQ